MKSVIILVLIVFSFNLLSYSQVKIIFDTDIGGDADDLAALAMLHAFISSGECELLAVMCWSTEKFAIPAIDAINRYYKHANIPLGARKAESFTSKEQYVRSIAESFDYKLTAEEVPDATDLYRKILSRAKDHSITIVPVGPLYNIQSLLKSEPDKYSKLNGKQLVNRKVNEFVIMGGQFPEGKNEWNFNGNMPGVTKFVLENINVPIIFSGFEIGMKIKSGSILNEKDHHTPLYVGYKYFSEFAPWMKQYYKGDVLDNSSFDQTAVLYAVRNGLGTYWSMSNDGTCIADSTGGNTWKEESGGRHSYLKLIEDPEKMAALIEKLMLGEDD